MSGSPAPTQSPSSNRQSMVNAVSRSAATASSHSVIRRGAKQTGRLRNSA